jgi:hypothetical protein
MTWRPPLIAILILCPVSAGNGKLAGRAGNDYSTDYSRNARRFESKAERDYSSSARTSCGRSRPVPLVNSELLLLAGYVRETGALGPVRSSVR